MHAGFSLQVYDWDRVGASDKLGQGEIDLKDLEPMQQSSVAVKLTHEGKQQGVVHMKMTFRPGFITRSRQATSTFTGLGRVATGLGGTMLSTGAGVGIGAVKGVGHVGGGVIKGVGGVGRIGFNGIRKVTGAHKRDTTPDSETLGADSSSLIGTPHGPSQTTALPTIPPGQQVTTPASSKLIPSDFKLTITDIGASGLENPDARFYVHVKRNAKALFDTKPIRHTTSPVWEETHTIDATANLPCDIELMVYEKKKLGKDKELGSLTIDVWQHILPQANRLEAEILEPLSNGSGNLHLKLMATVKTFASPDQAVGPGSRMRTASFLERDPTDVMNGGGDNSPPSPGGKSQKSISRFSLHRHR